MAYLICSFEFTADRFFTYSPVLFALQGWRLFSPYFELLGSPQFRRKLADLVVAVMPGKTYKRMREIIDTLDGASRSIVQDRKKALDEGDEALQQQIGEGKDIISSLRMLSLSDSAFYPPDLTL